jgi:hypothetical protein
MIHTRPLRRRLETPAKSEEAFQRFVEASGCGKEPAKVIAALRFDFMNEVIGGEAKRHEEKNCG